MNTPTGYKRNMEAKITEQNCLIDTLQQELGLKQQQQELLSSELRMMKQSSSYEIDVLREELQKERAISGELKNTLEDTIKDKYEKEINKLKDEIKTLKASESLKDKQNEFLLNHVEAICQKHNKHDNELELSRKLYEEKIEELKAAVKKEQEIDKTLPEQIKNLHEQLSSKVAEELVLKAELKACKANSEEMTSLFQSCQKQLESELNKTLEENSKLMKKIDCFESKEKQLSEMNSEYKNDLILLDKALNDVLNKTLEVISSYSNEKEDQIFNTSFENCECSEISRALETKIRKIFDKVGEIEEICYSFQSEVEKAENELIKVSKLETQRDHYETEVKKLKQEKNTLENERHIMESDMKNLKSKLEKYGAENENLLQTVRNLKDRTGTPSKQERTDVVHTPDSDAFRHSYEARQDILKMVTSTPFPRKDIDLKGGGENFNINPNIYTIVDWMEFCVELEKEKKQLNFKLEDLNMKLSEYEHAMKSLKLEMNAQEVKHKDLEKKIEDYSHIKSELLETREEKNQCDVKIQSLQLKLNSLEESYEKLSEENSRLEKNYKDSLDAYTDNSGNSDEKMNLFLEKLKEVAILKNELNSTQNLKKIVEDRLVKLSEASKLYVRNLEQFSRELSLKQKELDDVFQEKIKLSTSNKILENEQNFLKLRIDYLANLRENNMNHSSITLIENMQKEIIALCKSAIEKKLELDNMIIDTNNENFVYELDCRNRYKIMLDFNHKLQNEKDELLEKVVEMQKLLHSYQTGEVMDDNWLSKLNEFEKNLINEIGEHKQQYARIEEALRNTAGLHNDLQRSIDDMKRQNAELAKLEKKLESEKQHVKKLEINVEFLKKAVEEKDETIKITCKEKTAIEEKLKSVSCDLAKTKDNLNHEKIKWANCVQQNKLRVSNLEVLQEFQHFIDQKNVHLPSFSETSPEFWEHLQAEYNDAFRSAHIASELKLFKSLSKLQEEHKTQIENLSKQIHEQSLIITNLREEQVINNYPKLHQIVTDVQFKNILDEFAKHENELVLLEKSMKDCINTELFEKTKKSYENLFRTQLLIALKYMKEERVKQNYLTTETLKELHKEELTLVRLQCEIDQYKNTKETKPFKEMKFESSDIAKNLNAFMLRHYFNFVENFFAKWYKEYKNQIERARAKAENHLFCHDASPETMKINVLIQESSDSLLEQENLIKSAKGFIKSLNCSNEIMLDSVKAFADSFSKETINSLNNVKLKHELNNNVLALEESVIELKKEKTSLEQQLNCAMDLLKSDHENGINKANKLLEELKNNCDAGTGSSAILDLKYQLEEKHKKEMVELRTYFEKKCADMEKNYSEEIFSQHSRKMSSSCSESDLGSDNEPDLRGGGDNQFNLTGELGRNTYKDVELFKASANFEEVLVDDVGTSLAWNTINKVKLEIFQLMKDKMEREYVIKINSLANMMDEQLKKILDDMTHQEKKIMKLQERIHYLTVKSKKQLDLSKIPKSLIKNIEDLAIENLLGDISSLKEEELATGNFDSENRPLNMAAKIFYEKFNNLIKNQKIFYENEIEIYKNSIAKETSDAPLELASPSDLQLMIKERDDLRKIRQTLKLAVDQLATYINSCEDEFIKTIADKFIAICQSSDEEKPKKVHFAENISSFMIDVDESLCDSYNASSLDVTANLRSELQTHIMKLKQEANTILGLTSRSDSKELCKEIESLSVKNAQLLQEIEQLKLSLQCASNDDIESNFNKHFEAVYQDDENIMPTHFHLQSRVKSALIDLGKETSINSLLRVLEAIAKEGDVIIDDLLRDKEDLQLQIEAVGKQLRATKQFLDEQAVERESERDEFNKEVSALQIQLKEIGKENSIRERYNSEFEELDNELQEVLADLKSTKASKDATESELKAAVDKIWVLRDVIKDLESQINLKSNKEILLQGRLDCLEKELENQNSAQNLMVEELESLRNQSIEDNCLIKIQEMQDKEKYNSSAIRQFKTQINEMEKIIDCQTKELESLIITTSTNSLSSPSEEISIREQLEFLRCQTPECLSPVAFPADKVHKLLEKLQKHARADEIVVKKIKDQDIRLNKLTNYIEEMQIEHEVLQKQLEKQKAHVAESNNKIDFLRHKADEANILANRDLMEENLKIKEELKEIMQAFHVKQEELIECEKQLKHTREQVHELQEVLTNNSFCDQEVVDTIRLDLASVTAEKNKLEDLLIKCNREKDQLIRKYEDELNLEDMDLILSDKNEDIKHLHQTVSQLNNQIKNTSRSKGLKVSFAEQTPSVFGDMSKLRDAHHDSFEIQPIFDYEKGFPQAHSTAIPEEPELSRNILSDQSQNTLDQMKLELDEKNDRLLDLEKQIEDLKKSEKNLLNIKSQLETTINKNINLYEEKFKIQAGEINELLQKLEHKEKESIKTTADVKALQNLLKNLQLKLKQAQFLAENSNPELERLKIENIELKESQSNLLIAKQELIENMNKHYEMNEAANAKLETFTTAIKNLRNQLSNQVTNVTVDTVDDIKNLFDQISILIRDVNISKTNAENETEEENKQLQLHVMELQSKLNELKRINENNMSRFEVEIGKLQEDIKIVQESEKNGAEKLIMVSKERELLARKLALLEGEIQTFVNKEKISKEVQFDGFVSTLCDGPDAEQKSYHSAGLDLSRKLSMYENTIINKLEVINKLKNKQRQEEEKLHSLKLIRSELENKIDQLDRINGMQSRTINNLSNQLEEEKNRNLTLELMFQNEKSARVQLQRIKDEDKERMLESQKQDIQLIESMRIRLKTSMETETQLRAALIEEREKREAIEAKLNSIKVIKKYQSDSDNDDTLEVLLKNEKKNYELMKIEHERQVLHCQDLISVLNRERNSLTTLREVLLKKEQKNKELEQALKQIEDHLNTEKKYNKELENELRRLQSQPNDNQYKIALENAHSAIKDLEEDCSNLKEHLSSQQEIDSKWQSNIYGPVLQHLNDLVPTIDKLVKERAELRTSVDELKKERKDLESKIEQLQKITKKDDTLLKLKLDAYSERPSSREFYRYLDQLMFCESYRKSLVYQKRFLLLTLDGYRKAEMRNIQKIAPSYKFKTKKITFKAVAMLVLASIKIKHLTKRRKNRRQITLGKLIDAFDRHRCSSLDKLNVNQADFAIAASSRASSVKYVPHSPPCKDNKVPSYMDFPTNHCSEYLRCFDELQLRLHDTLHRANS